MPTLAYRELTDKDERKIFIVKSELIIYSKFKLIFFLKTEYVEEAIMGKLPTKHHEEFDRKLEDN